MSWDPNNPDDIPISSASRTLSPEEAMRRLRDGKQGEIAEAFVPLMAMREEIDRLFPTQPTIVVALAYIKAWKSAYDSNQGESILQPCLDQRECPHSNTNLLEEGPAVTEICVGCGRGEPNVSGN